MTTTEHRAPTDGSDAEFPTIDMSRLDITEQNVAVQKVLDHTDNPRHDDECRLLGEDVWEFDTAEAGLFRLDPADVLTAAQAGELLAPSIESLPAFDDSLRPQ